jgi:hypothetical protein
MRFAAAHDHRVGLSRTADVVGVAACAAHQRRILAARDRLADAEFGQGQRGFGGPVIHSGSLPSFEAILDKAGLPLLQE